MEYFQLINFSLQMLQWENECMDFKSVYVLKISCLRNPFHIENLNANLFDFFFLYKFYSGVSFGLVVS